MPGKVIHISDETHAKLKKLAAHRGVKYHRELVEPLIDEMFQKLVAEKPPKAVPVEKKPKVGIEAIAAQDGDPAAKPPFWKDTPVTA